MKYTIKTLYGISEGIYQQSTEEEHLAAGGTEQGSGASTAVWLSICIALFMAYKKNAPRRMKYQDPTSSIRSGRKKCRRICWWHENRRVQRWKSSPTDILTMLQTLTECAQATMGTIACFCNRRSGTFELSKCYSYQLLHWQWNKFGYPQIMHTAKARQRYSNSSRVWFPTGNKLWSKNILRPRPKRYNNCIQIIRIKNQIFRDDIQHTGHMGRQVKETSK